MICSECFHSDPKFYGCISVGTYKLVMIQFDNITLIFSDHTCNTYQFTWLIRNKYGYGKDTVTLDQSVLYNR